MEFKEFVFDGFGNFIMEFIADEKRFSTTLYFGNQDLFFSKELNKIYSPEQILIFRWEKRNKNNGNEFCFDLRKDLKGNHLNFDFKINGRSQNRKILPSDSLKKKRTQELLLHLIEPIPKKLKINIFHSKEDIKNKNLVKTYELEP